MRKIIYLIISWMTLVGCQEKTNIKLSKSDGVRGEMLVVSNQKKIDKRLMMLLNDTIAVDTPGLIFSEPLTTFKKMSPQKYKSKFIKHHSVLKIQLGEKGIVFKKNIQSIPQLIIEVSGKSQLDIFKTIIENRIKIIEALEKNEKKFSKSFLTKYDLHKNLKFLKKHKINLNVPNLYQKVIDNDSVLWFRRYEEKDMISMLITAKKIDSLKNEDIIKHRNLISEHYIRSSDSTYAKTETMVDPMFNKIQNFIFTTGMWQMEGDIFGGPFNSKTYYHKGYMYTFEGFLYAPRENTSARGMKVFKDNKNKKRDFFREIYSILDEFKFE